MMPLSPARRRTQVRRSFREPRPSPFLCAVRTRFGRKKEPLKPSGFTMPSWRMMSPTTRRVAVAVRARMGMPPSSCLSPLSLRYAGRKSCPHSEMQCASSTTTSDTFTPARKPRRLPSRPSGATQPIALGLPVERGVDHRRPEAVPRERVHLVLHERDERAHDEHGAGDEARGDLEGERLARARRHDADAVAPREHGRDDLLLPLTKVLVAEDAGQDVAGSEAGRERELIDAGRIAEMPR